MMVVGSMDTPPANSEPALGVRDHARHHFFKTVIRLVTNIQVLHTSQAYQGTKPKLWALPEPMPDYIRPVVQRLSKQYEFTPLDVDIPIMSKNSELKPPRCRPTPTEKKPKNVKELQNVPVGVGAFAGEKIVFPVQDPALGSASAPTLDPAFASDPNQLQMMQQAPLHPGKKPRALNQMYSDSDLYANARVYKRARFLPEQDSWDPANPAQWAGHQRAPIIDKSIKELMVEDMVIGEGTIVTQNSFVTISYTGVYRFDGEEITFTPDGEVNNFQFEVSLGEVIRGLDFGVIGMRVGGTRKLIIPAKHAYGLKGKEPEIPPYAPLIMVVTLKQVYSRVEDDADDWL